MTHPSPMILLAEDDPNDVLLIQRAFRKAAITTPLQVVKDGEEAVAYLSGSDAYADRAVHPLPALLLLDLKMPRRSGLEVLQWLRGQPALRRLRVVVLTSSRQGDDIDRAHDLGVNSYLLKPVKFEELIELMKNLDLYWMALSERPTVADAG